MKTLAPRILYEDDHVVAIDKPSGLVVHSDGRTKESNVSEWFVKKYPEARGVGELGQTSNGKTIERSGVVHRIDRDTSGMLLLARTKEGYEVLKKQFQNREIEKIYHLFVNGLVKDDFGTIKLSIGRSSSSFRKWSAEKGSKGERREALTYYKTLKRSENPKATFVEAKPKTGRTHQIRVHFKALHHAIVGDSIYAPKAQSLFGFDRLALHARYIAFRNVSGEKIEVTAPYPKDFQKAIDIIGFDVLD